MPVRAGGRTRAELLARVDNDLSPGFIRRGSITPGTRALYLQALADWDEWCSQQRPPLLQAPLEVAAASMERFFEAKVLQGATAALGRN